MNESTPFPDERNPVPPPTNILPFFPQGLPALFEDEGYEEMGETSDHTDTRFILYSGIRVHLREFSRFQVFSDLDLHYDALRPAAYVSADVMVVEPHRRLESARSYLLWEHGPAPYLMLEVLSERSAQQCDLTLKPIVYAGIGVGEYILVDTTSRFLGRPLLIRKLQPDGEWSDERDEDGGVTSALGFRVVLELDGQVRVIDAETGDRYARPEEAIAEAHAHRAAETTALKAEAKAELAR